MRSRRRGPCWRAAAANRRCWPAKKNRLALLVLPVAGLALGDPLDGLLAPAGAGGLGLGLGDPFRVVALLAWTEGFEVLLRRRHRAQRFGEIVGDDQWPRFGGLGAGRRGDAVVVQLHRL